MIAMNGLNRIVEWYRCLWIVKGVTCKEETLHLFITEKERTYTNRLFEGSNKPSQIDEQLRVIFAYQKTGNESQHKGV